MATQNVLNKIASLQQDRLVKLITVKFPSPIGTKYYCHLDKTSQADTTKYVWNSTDYICYPIDVRNVDGEQNIDGKLPDTELAIANIDEQIGEYIDTENLVDTIVECVLTIEGLTSGSDWLEWWVYKITEAAYRDEDYTAQFQLSTILAEFNNSYPLYIRDRNLCQWDYDADGSDAITSRTCAFYKSYYQKGGTLDTEDYPNADAAKCDKTLYGENGCAAHFNQKDALKPKMRARIYPGIPTTKLEGIG